MPWLIVCLRELGQIYGSIEAQTETAYSWFYPDVLSGEEIAMASV